VGARARGASCSRSFAMSKGKQRRHAPSHGCVDPDVLFGAPGDARAMRKDRQLCRQVHEALGYALPALDDEILSATWVMDVEPAPDASRLCAVVQAPRGADPEEVYARLERVSGYLRSEVAQAITRKRAPVLAFRVALAGAPGEEAA